MKQSSLANVKWEPDASGGGRWRARKYKDGKELSGTGKTDIIAAEVLNKKYKDAGWPIPYRHLEFRDPQPAKRPRRKKKQKLKIKEEILDDVSVSVKIEIAER